MATGKEEIDEAAKAIQAALASRAIAEELGPLLDGARGLAKETAGERGHGAYMGGEGAGSMHRWTPGELLALALRSREVRSLERIAASMERALPYLEKLTECVCRLADCECDDAPKGSTTSADVPPTAPVPSNVTAAAGTSPAAAPTSSTGSR